MKTKQEIPKWFNGQIYEEGDIVTNPFSKEEYKLNNIELSMYDFIMGANMAIEMGVFNTSQNIQDLRKALDWFRKNNGKAYMVLLD